MATSTKSDRSSRQRRRSKLSTKQHKAIDLLFEGKTHQETADAVDVTPATVAGWRSGDPYFEAEFNRRRRALWESSQERLRSLVGNALDTLEQAAEGGDVRAAAELLKAARAYGQGGQPIGAEDPEGVLWQQAKAWATAEHERHDSAPGPFRHFIAEEEIAKLANERLEELRALLLDESEEESDESPEEE